MFDPSRPASQTAPGGIARLARAGGLLRRGVSGAALKRWSLRLLVLVVALVVLGVLLLQADVIATNALWFHSVHAGSVYETVIWTRIGLFAVFAVVGGLISGATVVALRRLRPLILSPENDTIRWTFRRYEPAFGRYVVVLATLYAAVKLGSRAASNWQTFQLWWNATPFHTSDPLFHKDASFYIEVYPFHQLVVSLLMQAVTYALWIAAVGGYLYGGWRLRGGAGHKVSAGFVSLLSWLAAGYLVLRAANAWLARYALTTSPRGPVTGAGYTDTHASLPADYVLTVVCLLGAAAFVANAIATRRRRRLLGRVRGFAGITAVVAVIVLLAGTAWPGLSYHFQEAPSASKVDLPEIRHNQQATRAAFGLDGNVTTITRRSTGSASASSLVSLAGSTSQPPVIDPNQLSPTFNVEQQLQSYYAFKSTLDIGNYPLNGKDQDVALAVRELRSSGIPGNTWVNQHLVYTHGYGVVAAPTTTVDPRTQSPVFLNAGIPPAQDIPVSRPQVYFGQGFAAGSYAIVGQPSGSTRALEFDHPGGSASAAPAYTTYTGKGGVKVGSTLQRLLFAVRLRDPNILFSSELNSASQLLEFRDPRTRVAKVAPWLTLDGDVYPAVVNGHIEWIVDGYTTTSNFPYSQTLNLHSATNTTVVAQGASVGQANTAVNYMHNSVKAVVDAYTGAVTLYEWNLKAQPDPLLTAWEHVFPGLVKPQSDIPSDLVPQLRYPTDLFNVQRTLLAKYHVTSPSSFYSGNDFWTVPTDPTLAATNSVNGGSSAAKAPNLPVASRYVTMSPDGTSGSQYSLSTPMVTLNGHELAAFIDVDARPGPNYGKFTVLTYPSGAGGEAPSQVQNDIESNTTITEALTLQRGGNSSVVLGSLQAIPVGDRILYVEPVYTQSNGGSSFPVLRHVIALYGQGDPSFEDTLDKAISAAITSGTGSG